MQEFESMIFPRNVDPNLLKELRKKKELIYVILKYLLTTNNFFFQNKLKQDFDSDTYILIKNLFRTLLNAEAKTQEYRTKFYEKQINIKYEFIKVF